MIGKVIVLIICLIVLLYSVAINIGSTSSETGLNAADTIVKNINNNSLDDFVYTISDFKSSALQVNKAIDIYFAQEMHISRSISSCQQMMKYCHEALQGGGRLRPVICLTTAAMVSEQSTIIHKRSAINDFWQQNKYNRLMNSIYIALAIECIHCSSLIVDDLPEFDNDLIRRGEKSFHAKYGPAIAQITAINLLAYAFKLMTTQILWIKANRPKLVWYNIAVLLNCEMQHAIGINGAAGGQYLDSIPQMDSNDIIQVIRKKTSSLICLSIISGWVLERSDRIESIRLIGDLFGQAFQIADDIDDVDKDREKNAPNYANMYGIDNAKLKVSERINNARKLLIGYGLYNKTWSTIFIKIQKK